MNLTLYKQMMKVHIKGIMNYAIGSAFYMILMVWIYPSIADNAKSLNDLMKAMPAGVSKAFGLESGFNSFDSYISGEFYGLLLLLIMTIFCIMLSTQLIAKLVDQGSMAYLLSTPTTRAKIAITQAAVLVTGSFIILLITTISGFIGYYLFMEDTSVFRAMTFIQLNLGAFFLFFAVGGISFFISSLVNDEKRALGIAGSIAFGFFSLNLLGKISGKIEWLKNISIYTLYNPSEIVSGQADIIQSFIILGIIGLAAFIMAVLVFKKRDLPL
ncbi:ABC transporter permease subunit [Niallia sp. NCCP-28]|uniref:ABC transporter permease subunit n=1 Tax=Niallia sp. NCCP-28 TaxID=2934712 RepID=UPI00208D50A6|nr:ABC transporter permease subunit [Niallia sp. NCCP-28]GKU83055.1 ABC transporter permease [Niallia sp. NCCP-28]